ncbi:Lar family restriction alleviation protein [Bradyrhizobium sp. HKCCYLRH2015]|uniref:Lar family restriction alleviation protein n=1 Tax=Bradyrhizobium sp. HKCCYLRH2015 TaxID=3420742 RepID=UPI003EB904FF
MTVALQDFRTINSRRATNILVLDCPFCGEPPEVSAASGQGVSIACTAQECYVHPSVVGPTEKDAALLWNRRRR